MAMAGDLLVAITEPEAGRGGVAGGGRQGAGGAIGI